MDKKYTDLLKIKINTEQSVVATAYLVLPQTNKM